MNLNASLLRTCCFTMVMLLVSHDCHADIITFGSSNSALPYTETGYVFTSLSGNNTVIQQIGNLSNRILNLGVATPGQPSNVRLTASGGGAFDLVSLQLIGNSSFPWEIQGSNGSTFTVANGTPSSTLNFALLGDWTNLTSVNFVHSAGQINANLQIDNINVNAVPEPTCLAITALAAIGLVKRRLRKR